MSYDPMGRLYQVVQGASTTRMGYDGLDRIAEYDGSNAIQRRYIHGPGVDEPIVWYEGSGITTRRFLSSDERGSIISVTDGSGTVLSLNKYDEYGVPQSTNLGKFGYTGQAWVPEIGLWYYKARFLRPDIGRFMQTDPIGYDGDGPNLYAYVLNDPVNWVDPLGLCGANQIEVKVGISTGSGTEKDPIRVTVYKYCFWLPHLDGPSGNPWECVNRFLCRKDAEPDPIELECTTILCKDYIPEKPKSKKQEPVCDAECQAKIAAREKAICVLESLVNPEADPISSTARIVIGQNASNMYDFSGLGRAFMSIQLFNGSKKAAENCR